MSFEKENSRLVLFCGPSGSGKTTLVRHLMARFPQLQFSVSATTRPPRNGERDGVDYHFLSVDEFKRRIDAGEFLEWEQVYEGRYYGTRKTDVDLILALGKVVLFDVDVEGGLRLREYYGDRLLDIFIMPPSIDELHKRLQLRSTESAESLLARIKKAEKELEYAFRFNHILVNNDLETTRKEAEQLVADFLQS